jgi:hypothetical protein
MNLNDGLERRKTRHLGKFIKNLVYSFQMKALLATPILTYPMICKRALNLLGL